MVNEGRTQRGYKLFPTNLFFVFAMRAFFFFQTKVETV